MRDPLAPFEGLLIPRLWFALLCEGLGTDPRGRINLISVFNQVQFYDTPDGSDVPSNGFLNGVLAVGFTDGLGSFELEIEIRDVEDHVLWQRPEGRWPFEIGPGGPHAAVLAEQVRHWFTQPGRYYFLVRLLPSGEEHRIPFEVGRQIGPLERADEPPATPQ